ncbi:MAG TPA: aldehyde dehydrogenase family protein, partial [Micromonosporaceae bacterium]
MTVSAAPQMFVAGDWRGAASGETYNTTSPATGEEIAAIPQGDRADAQAAIAAAAGAADAWGRTNAFERAARMHAVGDVIESRRDALARTLTLD